MPTQKPEPKLQPGNPSLVPDNVREASHDMANVSAKFVAHRQDERRRLDPFGDWARAMQGEHQPR